MIGAYIKERRSWIGFFLVQQLLLVLVVFVDTTIPFSSILYVNFLSALLFLVFFFVRLQKESAFYRELQERDTSLDGEPLAEAESPFQKIVHTYFTKQVEQYKQEASRHRTELEQEKDDLMSWVHEVKTPLTAMHLMIDRIEDERMKAQLTYEWLRVHLLLDRQLHQKRMPFIKNDLYVEHVALEPLLFTEIRSLQSWCLQKGIGFDVEITGPPVLSDAKWLAFIFRQLLTNAVKYSDSGDIMIRSIQRGNQTAVAVTDFGRGISPQDLPRIFDKGFTATGSFHQNDSATGMGLYLAKKAADSLLIELEAVSHPGSGTTFTLTFPEPNAFVRLTSM
ncbi:sensor histidine kinase [Domibacillus indicus]|uniref:sensor histidine kinase n=1 Tax=Domibacillus indicus TaxID=1437523 RepID=UPI0020409EE4|nr:sensor histidine kinase [Domibacillus indicus]MCM3788590.1 sensor histidine kinase [Domibacillus indicus]